MAGQIRHGGLWMDVQPYANEARKIIEQAFNKMRDLNDRYEAELEAYRTSENAYDMASETAIAAALAKIQSSVWDAMRQADGLDFMISAGEI